MSSFLNSVGGIGSLAAGAGNLAASVNSFLAFLHPASWRGVPFGVTTSAIKPGRQTAVHTYPFRDTQWVEDIGRGPRPFSITGFLVENDVVTFAGLLQTQRAAMVQACEAVGPGVLVHPALGSKTVSLIGGCRMMERVDLGRVIELTFEFLETAPGPAYPSNTTSSAGAVQSAAASANTSAAGNFASSIVGPVQAGAAIVAQGAATVQGFTNMALAAVGGAQRIVAATTGLVGSFGRYANGNILTAQPLSATSASLLAASTTARTAVQTTGVAAVASAKAL